jgi:hypothetical protein
MKLGDDGQWWYFCGYFASLPPSPPWSTRRWHSRTSTTAPEWPVNQLLGPPSSTRGYPTRRICFFSGPWPEKGARYNRPFGGRPACWVTSFGWWLRSTLLLIGYIYRQVDKLPRGYHLCRPGCLPTSVMLCGSKRPSGKVAHRTQEHRPVFVPSPTPFSPPEECARGCVSRVSLAFCVECGAGGLGLYYPAAALRGG